MRQLLIALAVSTFVALSTSAVAIASDTSPDGGGQLYSQAQEIDDNDDTRVEVQLVVLAVAGVTVFVLGTGAFLLRRKLGLVPPPPEPGGDGHH